LMSSRRFSSSGTRTWDRLRVSANDSLQNSMPVQAIRFLRQCGGSGGRVQRVQARDKVVDHVVGDIQNGQLLVRREPDAVRARRIATADGLLVAGGDRLVLTDRGRLLADAVVCTLLND
jgi:hypothetical protein